VGTVESFDVGHGWIWKPCWEITRWSVRYGSRIRGVSYTAAYKFSFFVPETQIPCMSSLAQSLTVRSRPQDAMNLASSVTSAASTVPS